MIDGIEPLYLQIAEGIRSSIHEPWQTATVDAVFFSENIRFAGEYFATEGGRPKSFGVGLNIIRPFRSLRELFKSAGKPLWCRACFEIRADGKFKMNWIYDGCDEDGFAPFDEAKEAEEFKQRQGRQGGSS